MKKILALITGMVLLLLCSSGTASAKEADDAWQFELTAYGWFSGIDGGLQYPVSAGSGGDISVDASDILENMEMIFMGGFSAQKNRWSLLADVIYMDVGNDVNRTVVAGPAPGVPVNADVGLDLSSWILSGGGGYDLVQSDRGVLTVVGGVRYLQVDVDARMGLNGPLPFPGPAAEKSLEKDLLDGIVGLRGYVNLNENWYLPYHADIGTGDSDLTWQLFAGIGYRFGWGDIRLGYRYLKYELGDGKLLEDLALSGPLMGVGFRF